jgi:hypothetical protein
MPWPAMFLIGRAAVPLFVIAKLPWPRPSTPAVMPAPLKFTPAAPSMVLPVIVMTFVADPGTP